MQEGNNKKKKSKWAKNKTRGGEWEGEEEADRRAEEFQVNVDDPRFASVFTDPRYPLLYPTSDTRHPTHGEGGREVERQPARGPMRQNKWGEDSTLNPTSYTLTYTLNPKP